MEYNSERKEHLKKYAIILMIAIPILILVGERLPKTDNEATTNPVIENSSFTTDMLIVSKEGKPNPWSPYPTPYIVVQANTDSVDIIAITANRGRCGITTRFKLPIHLNFGQVLREPLNCKYEEILEVDIATNLGNASYSMN